MAEESAQNHSRVTPPLSMPASPMNVTLSGCRHTAWPLPENTPMLSLKHLGTAERKGRAAERVRGGATGEWEAAFRGHARC